MQLGELLGCLGLPTHWADTYPQPSGTTNPAPWGLWAPSVKRGQSPRALPRASL